MQKKSVFQRQRHAAIYYFHYNFLIVFFILLTFTHAIAQSESSPSASFVQLLSPPENQVSIAKKPLLKVKFSQLVSAEELFVMLDSVDITGVLDLSPGGFEYKPINVLVSGDHALTISGTTAGGEPFNREFSFSTRHYKALEMGYSSNEFTALLETALSKSDSLDALPDTRLEANLSSESMLKEKGWDASFKATLRYLDQDTPTFPPEEEGMDLIDFLLTAGYTRGSFMASAEAGNTQVDLSENTISYLIRRGGQLALGSNVVKVGGYSVKSTQTYGSDGGLGIGSDTKDHILGAYGDINFLENRLSIRGIYSKGGEPGSSFGIVSEEGPTEGSVAGVLLKSDFLDGKLVSEFEYDRSDFDPDVTDSLGPDKDKAYRFVFEGSADRYTYGASYKYFGPKYRVVGNQGLERDRKGLALNGGAGFDKHALALTYSRYQDNVEKDVTLPRVLTQTAGIDYSFYGIENLPINLAYQKEIIDSSEEPPGTDPTDRDIDTFSGSISYTYNTWSFGFQGSYADDDDKTVFNADTTSTTLTFVPQYFSEKLVVAPNFSFYRTKDQPTDVYTDSFTTTADIQGRVWDEKITYGLGGMLDITTASDDSIDQRSINIFYTLNYLIGKNIWGHLNPALGLRGEYNLIYDRLVKEKTRDYLLMLIFTASVPFSF